MKRFQLVSIAAALLVTACGSGDSAGSDPMAMEDLVAASESLRPDIELLANVRGYFGHQSVGFNLLDGVADIAGDLGATNLRVIEVADLSSADGNGIFHREVGRNRYPNEKVDDFVADMRAMSDSPPDVALVKFCYADFPPEANVQAVFEHYQRAVDSLSQEYPHTVIVHSTVPLKARKMDLKSRVRRFFGREDRTDESNILRHEFSELIRSEYASQPIFDIMRFESTRTDGSRVSFSRDGREYYSMDPAYTYDGGHLNEFGRRLAAAEMVRVMADAIRQNQSSDQ